MTVVKWTKNYILSTADCKCFLWSMYHWNRFEGAHQRRYCKSHKKSPQVLTQESHRCTSPSIPCAKNSLGCFANHRTMFCTLLSDINIRTLRAFLMIQTHENHVTISPGYKQDVLTSFPAAWHSVGPANSGPLVDGHCHAARWCSEFAWAFVLDLGTQLLKCLSIMVCIDCVVTWFEVEKQWYLDDPLVMFR
jgi:hypothetical protein